MLFTNTGTKFPGKDFGSFHFIIQEMQLLFLLVFKSITYLSSNLNECADWLKVDFRHSFICQF